MVKVKNSRERLETQDFKKLNEINNSSQKFLHQDTKACPLLVSPEIEAKNKRKHKTSH